MYIGVFSTILFFALGLVGWAAAGRYYDENLKPAAVVDDRRIPMRDFNRRLAFDKVRFYQEVGIPEEAEGDPQVQAYIFSLRKPSLDALVSGEMMRAVARDEDALPTREAVAQRAETDYGEVHVRHILVKPAADAPDAEQADAEARAKAQQLAEQLRADPMNDQLWKEVAASESADDFSKETGGDLGWVGRQANFVEEFETAMFALADGVVSDPVKSEHGYHVIQRIETRAVTETPFFARLRKAGITLDDLLGFIASDLLRDRYEQLAKEATIESPQEQVRLAHIVMVLPSPADPAYGAALKKINDVTTALDEGKDFADVAREFSDDGGTRENGGEIGWVTRSMLRADEVRSDDKTIVDDVFKREVGERSFQHRLPTGDIVIYKILEKDPAREVTEDQKTQISEDAFSLWLSELETRLRVQRLIPGLEF